MGVLSINDALRAAEEAGLDLVEVSPKAIPPVCRIMDFGKYKYELKKKAAESRKHQSHVVVKEVKFRPKTEEHDYQFKVRHITRFLQEGNKVKSTVIFRGRENAHHERGREMLGEIIEKLQDVAKVEKMPSMEGGKSMIAVLTPKG